MLLRPGRGPLRPRAEEAGKEARRRERGMIHPEEPELETLQPGNSLVPADGRARRGVRWTKPCTGPRSSPPPARHSPAAGAPGSLFRSEFKETLGNVSRWSWSERSSWSLAQVSPAAASVLTEEAWKEAAGGRRL